MSGNGNATVTFDRLLALIEEDVAHRDELGRDRELLGLHRNVGIARERAARRPRVPPYCRWRMRRTSMAQQITEQASSARTARTVLMFTILPARCPLASVTCCRLTWTLLGALPGTSRASLAKSLRFSSTALARDGRAAVVGDR